MKAKINYRSKKTIIIISVAVVLLIAAIVGTVAFVKGNQDAAAAMTDDGTSTSQNDGANAGLPNNGDQNNGDDQNNNGTTLPEVGDNTNPADSNNNGNNGSTTNSGTTGTNGANGSNTGANAGTTTGTTTTGNNGANVPNQDYTQTTVIPGRDNVLVEQNTEIGWSPISVAAYTAASKLKVHKPDLDLQKYAYLDGDSLEELPVNTAVQKGETITYVIKITNNGNEDANGIRTIDSIPEGTELAPISEGGALNNDGKIVWKNDIKAGETVTVSFKVVVTADSIDLINNIAKVNGEETPETKTPVITANKTAQVVKIVDKEEVLENRDAKVGETIRYTITAKNTTEVDGTTVIKDSIPDGTSFVDGTITEKGNFDKENGTITWNNVVVPAKGEVSVSFDVVVNEKTIAGEVVKSVSNTATIGNTSTEEVETKVANITGEKKVSDKVANVGDTLTYTIILTNNGNGDGKVTVTDAIPKGTKIKVATTDGYDLETNTMTWKNVEVKAGKSVELTLEVVVEDNISIIKNIAYVDGNKIPEEPETSVKHHYAVEHYTENLDGTYSKVEKDTVVSEDVEIGTKVSYKINNYDGFTFDESKTENKDATVPDNNNLVVKLYYTRNSYKVTYEYEGSVPTGASESPVEATYKYGASVTVAEDATAPGYTFSGWDKEDFTMPANDVVIKGHFTANTNTEYKVEHYLEDLDGKTFTLKDTETLAGTTDTTATATPKQYPGFTFNENVDGTKTSGTITGDGQLVLKLYYTRNSYKVTYEYEEEAPTGASELPAEATYKYGASVTVAEDATAPGYTFSGWDKEDFTMPANDVVIKGHFTANTNTEYKVEHYLEDLDGKTFTLKDTETLAGTTDTTATATSKQYPGFTFNENVEGTKTSGIITGDGKLVLKLYYTRNSYSYTIKYVEEGNEKNILKTTTGEAKYEEEIDVTKETFEGYTYVCQDKEKIKIDTTNNIATVYYTRNSYKVTYEYEEEAPTGASELPAEATYKYGASVTVAEDATAPGYTFSGWDKEDFTMPANDVVIKGHFTANTNTEYKVEHYLEDLDGKTFTLKDTETLAGTTDTTATATPKQYPGFTFNENVDGTKTSGTITGDGQLVLKLYYTRNTYKYTVHYFYNGVEDKDKADEFEALYEEKINEYTIKNQGRYTEYNKESSNRTKEALLVIGTGSNYINVYYGTPNVTISKNVNKTAVKVGDTLHYTIKVTETRGFVDASGVNVTDTIPEGLENIRNITQKGVVKGSKIEWNNLAITKNSSITLEFDATVSVTTIGKTISNTANLGGTTSGDSNTVTTTVSELKAAVKEVKKGTTGKDAVNVVLVMDLSYSMQEKKTTDNVTRLEAAKTAATKFINSIYTKDPESKVTVTVLTFNTANPLTTIKYVGTERCTNNNILHLHWNCKNIDGVWYSKWEEQKVAIPYSGTSKLGFADKTNYGALVNEINNISLPAENPDGGLGTNVSAALDLTKTTIGDLKDNHSENSNVVILLSDGAPTTSYSGNSSSNNYEGLRNQASEIKGNPITTEFYSIQFGTEKGAEKLLKAMSSNNTVYTSNSIDSLVENFTNILDQNTTKDPIDTVNGKYTTTLSNPLVVDADNPITVTYKGTTLFTCTSLPNNGLTYDSTTKTLTWDINAWNAVEGHTKVTTNDIVIQCYVER